MDLWTRLRDVHARWDVLRHPFYERWSAGSLTRRDLAVYAGEYREAVVALAAAAAAAARAADDDDDDAAALAVHAGEEAAHVSLWEGFADAAGGAPSRPAPETTASAPSQPAPETSACAAAWAGDGRDLLGHLVALYAIESAQPAISRLKASGLREHYGFDGGAGTAYFDLHATLDVEHAAEGRALLEARLPGADEDALVAEAERVLRANWELLDGVERLCGR
jgi:pyrroloquinoline-quinone synthase